MKDLTPEHLRCATGMSCHSIHESDDGRLVIVGDLVAISPAPSPGEVALAIAPEYLDDFAMRRLVDLGYAVIPPPNLPKPVRV